MAVLLSVVSSLLVGLILTVAPWTALWDANYLIGTHSALRSFVLSAFTRGAVSGLGVVNILLAINELRQHLFEQGGDGA